MKRQYTLAVLALSATVLLAGCSWSDVKSKIVGGDTATTSAVTGESVVVVEDYKPGDCVTLAEYKGVEVDVSVSDSEIQKEEFTALQNAAVKTEKVKKGTVKPGYTVNIDFTGKMDGKEFEGGSAQDQELVVGLGNFIEDLENGIVGMKVGETKDIDVTFPKSYQKAELAGKPAVFTVKLNSMSKFKKEFDDAFVKKNTTYKTVKEYEKAKREELLLSKKNSAGQTALETVLDNSTFNNIPPTLIEAQKQQMDHNYRYSLPYSYAQYYGSEVDFSTVLEAMGMTMEDYEKQLDISAENNAKIILLVEAIAGKENMKIEKSAIDDFINENASGSGTTVDQARTDYETVYGKAISFEDFSRTSYIYDKVLELVKNNAVIKE